MSLNLSDLGLVDTVRDILADLNAGNLIVISSAYSANHNPYSTNVLAPTPTIIGNYPFISYEDGTKKSNEEQAIHQGGEHRVKIALPVEPIKLDYYAYINFSNETRVIGGVISSVVIPISSVVRVTIMETDSIPFTWNQIKDLL